MTVMRVTLAGTRLSGEQKQGLSRRLIDAFAAVEVGEVTPIVRTGFVVSIDEVETSDLWMGDAPMSAASPAGKAALVTTQVMAGPWTNEMKAELFGAIESIVREVAGMPREGNGADFWMTISEVPEGGWGLGGRPVSIATLAPVFEPDRRERIEAYLKRLGGQ